MLPNLAETAQFEETDVSDTSNMLAACQLGVDEHAQVTYGG